MPEYRSRANFKKNEKRRKLNKPFRFTIFLVIILAVLISLFLIGYKFANPNSDKSNNQTTQETSSPTENPSSVPSSSPAATAKPTESPKVTTVPNQNVSELKRSIIKYTSNLQGVYGVYYYNLADGSSFGINSTQEYIAASTSKIAVNLYLYKKIEAGEISRSTKITYESRDYEGGTGSLQYKKKGTSYTVVELSKLSIEQSDNVATNMIQRYLGGRRVIRAYMKELGGVVAYGYENISCPKDMALYINKIYDFSKSNPALGGQLINYLQNTIFNDRIPKYLPKDIKIAHKIGNWWSSEWGTALHDIGIVYTDKPYIISIMTKHVTESEAYESIAQISKKVYDFVTK